MDLDKFQDETFKFEKQSALDDSTWAVCFMWVENLRRKFSCSNLPKSFMLHGLVDFIPTGTNGFEWYQRRRFSVIFRLESPKGSQLVMNLRWKREEKKNSKSVQEFRQNRENIKMLEKYLKSQIPFDFMISKIAHISQLKLRKEFAIFGWCIDSHSFVF